MKGRGSQPKIRLRSGALDIRGIFPVSRGRDGYTIVEVMVFLAVTTAIFAMIAGTFSGRQASTEFSVAAREMESQLQDIANDIATGFYNNPGNFTCTVNAGVPSLGGGTNQQGTNNQCIFIGKVAQFDLENSNGKQYNLYPVVGARQISGRDVQNFDEAKPRAIATSADSSVDLTESLQIPPGLVVRSMYSQHGSTKLRIRAIGFFSTFGAGSSDPKALDVNVIPLGIPPATNSKADTVNAISGITDSYAGFLGNPDGGVFVCMDGDRTDQHALLKLGGNDRQLTTDVTIEEGTCADAGYPA